MNKYCSKCGSVLKKADYNPYGGPAGPTEEQTEANNQALMKELDKLKIEYAYRDIAEEVGTDFPFIVIRIDTPLGLIDVGYDRWGFVIEGEDLADEELLDQVNMKEAIEGIQKLLKGESTSKEPEREPQLRELEEE